MRWDEMTSPLQYFHWKTLGHTLDSVDVYVCPGSCQVVLAEKELLSATIVLCSVNPVQHNHVDIFMLA